MSDTPWSGDVVGLVEAFRAGERSPSEELEATLAAVEANDLNAVCHVDAEAARVAAAAADVSLPYGGVPLAVKELLAVGGWPASLGSLPLADEVFDADGISVERLKTAGAIAAVQTTSSEFGATNQTTTKIHGATRNPWNLGRTPGGARAVRLRCCRRPLRARHRKRWRRIDPHPRGFCGLIGLKSTFGRIPRGPGSILGNATAVEGTVSRSTRDAARYLDVTNGFDPRDPRGLPRVEGYEAGLGSCADEIRSLRVAVVPDLSCAVVGPETEELIVAAAEELIALRDAARRDRPPTSEDHGRVGCDRRCRNPHLARRSLARVCTGLGGSSGPDSAADTGFTIDAMARAESRRAEFNSAMAVMFDQVDIVLAATNPSTAFGAEGHLPGTFEGRESNPGNNGALTAPSNIYGNPAIALPAGLASDGLPVSLQVLAPHFREDLLLDLALQWEREHPVELAL